MAEIYSKDLEAGKEAYTTTTATATDVDSGTVDEIARTRHIQRSFGVLRKLREGEEWLDRKMGIETQGIDRVAEEDKRPPSMWNILLLWFSLNIHIGVVPLGLLGASIFGLTFNQNVAAMMVGNVLGALCTAYDGTLGPKTGLRAIATSRYSFGFWGAKLCSVLNVIVGGGYFVVNLVVVGELLSAVSDFRMSITVGIVIVAIVSYVVSIFGYRIIHTYEKYSWIVTFILLLVLVGQAAPHVDINASGTDAGGLPLAGAFLTVAAILFSNASGWCSIAADYYVQYPASTPSWKVFALTYFGVLIPVSFSTITGAVLGNAAVTAAYGPYSDAYTANGLGGLVAAAYHPTGWSKFCLVILTFSVLGNNIAINYSSGLSLQLLGNYFHAVPRFIWSFLVALVVAILAIAGQQNLSNIIADFVGLLGYWTVSFTVILCVEDQWFRRRDGYDLVAWDNPAQLPWGVAGVFSLLAGYLAGGVTGMSQTWFVGPIAARFGGGGGDVGIFMSGAITLVAYPIARTIEKRLVGR